MKTIHRLQSLAGALALAFSAAASAVVPIVFNPEGTGTNQADQLTVVTFDWLPGNALAFAGNPANGIAAGDKIIFLSHATLGTLLNQSSSIVWVPTDKEFTFVAGAGEIVTSGSAATGNLTFALDPASDTNFFEIWVKTPPPAADMLAGTGFGQLATSSRILFGRITDVTGNYTTANCPIVDTPTGVFDQYVNNDYPGQLTICGSGGTSISVQIAWADPNYFPTFTPDVIDTVKAFFNTSTVTPFQQADPSAAFIANGLDFDGSGTEASISPTLGAVNGGIQTTSTLDFQIQADANQSYELGTVVAGGCRVTYGGNDKNGNIDPNKFGQACSGKGNNENCYTFGGQVGAPTANPALGGPFGEHTHHQVTGPAGDFVFRAGTHSAPKTTRITATACKDPGACRQAVANAGFKQIDFEGTGSFRTMSAQAKAYLIAHGAPASITTDNVSDQGYYFRVDMDDTGEPGNKPSKNKFDANAATQFLAADQNNPLSTADPLLTNYGACNTMADVYQFYICKDATPCEQKDAIYAVRGFLTGGNIQLHQIIK